MARKPSEIRADMERLLEERLVRNDAGKLVGGRLPTDPERWEELQAEINALINRVGRKIAVLRQAIGDSAQRREEFIDFRNHLYTLPEDEREAAVNEKLAAWGLTDG